MTSTTVQSLTNVGNLADGDKFVGERVDGTTVRITFNGTAITTLGTITSGTWHGTPVTVEYGGTGLTSATSYGVMCGGTTSTGAYQSVTPGAANTLLISGGAASLPTWTSDIPTATTIGSSYVYRAGGTDVSLADGGTGASLTDPNADRVLFWDDSAGATTWLTMGTNLSITGTTLDASGGATAGGADTNVQYNNAGAFAGHSGFTYNGAGVATLSAGMTIGGNATAAGYIDLLEDSDNGSNKVTITAPSTIASDKTITLQDVAGTLYVSGGTDVPVADGGTGLSSTTAYAVLCGGTTSTSPLQPVAALGSSGHVLTSNGAGALPTFQASTSPSAAAQSDQETATSTTTYVSPGRQQFHPSASKAWFSATYSGTPTLQESYNISSLTDTGTGIVTVNFTTAFTAATYSAVGSAELDGGVASYYFMRDGDTARTTTSCRMAVLTSGYSDGARELHFQAFGDQ